MATSSESGAAGGTSTLVVIGVVGNESPSMSSHADMDSETWQVSSPARRAPPMTSDLARLIVPSPLRKLRDGLLNKRGWLEVFERFGVIYLLKNDDVVQAPDSGALGVRDELLSDPVELGVLFG